jgi:hypothetical protein
MNTSVATADYLVANLEIRKGQSFGMPKSPEDEFYEQLADRIAAVADAWIDANGGRGQARDADLAARLGYNPGTFSKIKGGKQRATFADVLRFSEVDPKGRGLVWLGWGLAKDPTFRVKRPSDALAGLPFEQDAPVPESQTEGKGRRKKGA